MIADEFRKDGGIEVPFFKGTVFARRGPVTLALRTGAALVPACVYRQADGTLRLIIEPELELDRTSKGTEQVKENTLRMTRWLEQTIQAHPDQWNWMNVRWWQSKNQNNLQSNEQLQSKA
jgi:KDO2-lipid IV(A) lauroyltransferase